MQPKCVLFVTQRFYFCDDGTYYSKSWIDEVEQTGCEIPRWKIEDGKYYVNHVHTQYEWQYDYMISALVIKAYNQAIDEIAVIALEDEVLC